MKVTRQALQEHLEELQKPEVQQQQLENLLQQTLNYLNNEFKDRGTKGTFNKETKNISIEGDARIDYLNELGKFGCI